MPLSHAGALLANLSVTWSECDLIHVSSSYSDIIISYIILQSMFYYEYVWCLELYWVICLKKLCDSIPWYVWCMMDI